MARVRISTTVDATRLDKARELLDAPDSTVVDEALGALIDLMEAQRELAALAAHPYEDDPELQWEAEPGPDLPYDGEVPAAVLEMARRRRREA